MYLVDLDKIEFLKCVGNEEFNHGVDCCINRLLKEETIKAIPLDKIKQAREELTKKVIEYSGSGNEVTQSYCDGLKYNLAILNELIEEVEE